MFSQPLFTPEEFGAIQQHTMDLAEFLVKYLNYPADDPELLNIVVEEAQFIMWLSTDKERKPPAQYDVVLPSQFFPHELTL